MKKLWVLIPLLVVFLAGCSPQPEAKAPDCSSLAKEIKDLRAENAELTSTILELKGEIGSGKDSANIYDKYNKLVGDYANLRTKYAVLEASYESTFGLYKELSEKFSGTYQCDKKALTEMNEQYRDLANRQEELRVQIEKVKNKEVQLLSDNLTDEEYNAFYKGWDLWWGSWHAED